MEIVEFSIEALEELVGDVEYIKKIEEATGQTITPELRLPFLYTYFIYALKRRDNRSYEKEYRYEPGGKEEQAIAKDGPLSLWYAHTTKLPFPLGEPAISKIDHCSYEYASDILKGPFPAGEKAISKSGLLSLKYAKRVLQGRFPAGEPTILNSDPYYSYVYAMTVVKGRFEAGEPNIYLCSSYNISDYENMLNKIGNGQPDESFLARKPALMRIHAAAKEIQALSSNACQELINLLNTGLWKHEERDIM